MLGKTWVAPYWRPRRCPIGARVSYAQAVQPCIQHHCLHFGGDDQFQTNLTCSRLKKKTNPKPTTTEEKAFRCSGKLHFCSPLSENNTLPSVVGEVRIHMCCILEHLFSSPRLCLQASFTTLRMPLCWLRYMWPWSAVTGTPNMLFSLWISHWQRWVGRGECFPLCRILQSKKCFPGGKMGTCPFP